MLVRCVGLCAGIRFGVFAFALASALWCLPFERRPCAGRHLLCFAAAKKSRQKKAANTANISHCLRAPNRSYASHGSVSVCPRCQRSEQAPHPLHAPAFQHAAPAFPPPPRWQTMCRLSRHTRTTPDRKASSVVLVRALTCTVRQPTHSLPPGRHKPFAAASP